MNFLRLLTPINLQEEKEKFFADNSYNPQFRYIEKIDQEKLLKYGLPQPHFLEKANAILEKTYSTKTETDLLKEEGPIVSQQEVSEKITTFLAMHNLTDRIEVVWSASFIPRASIDATTIRLKSTAEFRKDNLLSLLYHEIGTHALRRINYEQQPWYRKKKKYGFGEYLFTEEGLATLHSLLPKQNKLAYPAALRYTSVDQAQRGSFVELWNYLSRYIDNLETRWMVCAKEKRGLSDTSKPGGYSKDIVYFEGILETWEWLHKNEYDITPLYFGKIAAQDATKAAALNPNFEPRLPTFFYLNKEVYQHTVEEIGKENELL